MIKESDSILTIDLFKESITTLEKMWEVTLIDFNILEKMQNIKHHLEKGLDEKNPDCIISAYIDMDHIITEAAGSTIDKYLKMKPYIAAKIEEDGLIDDLINIMKKWDIIMNRESIRVAD